MPLGGIEGRVVIPAGETDPHAALIQWATHASALRQKGTAAYWEPEWIPHDELKPLRKLSKGFAFYKPEMQEGHRVWVRDIT
jgi:hypothetical protein